ncbi:TSC22 domain family protein 2 isoform X1 [Polypterus senegalus]|uniref:TSC22 domain family protein 2 isoform X1 n=1 Tax=Polypterus senegalus TaxID=55291 RepID=UPI001965EC24|nr:TSC22 domain family protein 2 isoform X1 [Polypterus senegalus]
MSKMPTKKKSCFQITSVTQAQVAASSITDETESLDDPDESRTEDVSSEIFDVSRATDFEPEEVCERSSSEETLNNVAETEVTTLLIPQDGQLGTVGTAPPNGTFSPRSVLLTGHSVAANIVQVSAVISGGGQPQPPTAQSGVLQPIASTMSSGPATASQVPPAVAATTCSSRFRVIKLDHGTGEPFRRGRWTCMEFYERDSEGSVITRTVDSIRNANVLDHNTDRDSGLGATGGSIVAPSAHSMQGPDATGDSLFIAASQLHQSEGTTPSSQQQTYSIGQPSVGGSVAHGCFQPQVYPPLTLPSQQMLVPPVQTQVTTQPSAPQTLLPQVHSGISIQSQNVPSQPPGIVMPSQQPTIQKPASVAPVTQPQQFPFQGQPSQVPPVHLLPTQTTLVPSTQSDYLQHLPIIQQAQQNVQGSTAQTLQVSSLPVGQSVIHGSSPVITPAAPGAQLLGLQTQPGDSAGQVAGVIQGTSAPALCVLQQQGGGVVQQGVGAVSVVAQQQPQPMSQLQPPGVGGSSQVSGVPSGPHPVVAAIQNVPAIVPTIGMTSGSSSVPAVVPSVSSTPATMPNVPSTTGQSSLPSQSQSPRSTTLSSQTGGQIMQNVTNIVPNLPQTNFVQFQAQSQPAVSQADENRRMSDVLPQPPVISGKEPPKPPVPENQSAATPVNNLPSVLRIQLPIDGDEERNPSTAFYQAFSGSKIQDSKNINNGTSVTSAAIDNKIEQAMDLVKSHLMYAVREEVEVLKEQIKELYERNSVLERENALLKSLANNEQLSQLSVQLTSPSNSSLQQQQHSAAPPDISQPTQLQQQPPNVSSS